MASSYWRAVLRVAVALAAVAAVQDERPQHHRHRGGNRGCSALHQQHFGVCRCQCTLVDVGLNTGATLDSWPRGAATLTKISPRLAARMKKMHLGDDVRWVLPAGSPAQVGLSACAYSQSACYYGFEGNPAFTPSLQKLEARSRQRGMHVKLFTSNVLSLHDGIAELFVDDGVGKLGSSLAVGKSDMTVLPKHGWVSNATAEVSWRHVNVTSTDAARFLLELGRHSDFLGVKIVRPRPPRLPLPPPCLPLPPRLPLPHRLPLPLPPL